MTANQPAGNIPSLTRFAEWTLPEILSAVDPARATAMAAAIVENDRWNSFDRWHETSRRLCSAYDACGVTSELYSINTGGVRGNGKWVIPEAADVHGATLDLIEPIARQVADYEKCPWHVAQWSAATPANGITCELIVIDTAEQLAATAPGALAGKFVLTRLNPWLTRAKFCVAGAAGLLCDQPVAGCPDAVAWTKFGWGGLDLWEGSTPLVGFAISTTEGDALRALHQQRGRLVIHAKMDIRRYAGSHDVISGVIRGSEDPDAEIWAVAHSAEPGALDNASGGAVCVEIARVLTSLIEAGKIRQPRRTIRLLHGYECYGFFHYLEHVKRLQPPLAGVCIDTVGARPDVCGGELSWHATAPASASFVDDIGYEMLRATLALRPVYQLKRKAFLSTEDTLLGDPQYGFPCPWITNHPCRGYHSSADTIELLHPDGMAASAAAMAGYLYYLANVSTNEATEIADAQTRATLAALSEKERPPSWACRESLRQGHQASIDRLKRFTLVGDHAANTRAFDACAEAVAALDKENDASRSVGEVPADSQLIPLRRLPLAPTPENIWPAAHDRLKASLPKWAAYWANGRRTLADIHQLVLLEAEADIPLHELIDYFKELNELRFVDFCDADEFLTVEQLTADFIFLGIKPGMDLIVHSSMKSIGPVSGGPAAVVNALLRAIGTSGTLLAPTFNHHQARLFNPLTAPTNDGAIPDAIWRRPDALRSLHPSHSIAAIGPRAAEYIADHLTNGVWAANSPIGRLIQNDGHILSIGVGHDRSTAYHLAEISLDVPCLDQFGSVDQIAGSDGKAITVRGLAWRNGECPVDPAGLDPMLAGKQSAGNIGHARATLARAADVFNARRQQLGDRCKICPIRPERRN